MAHREGGGSMTTATGKPIYWRNLPKRLRTPEFLGLALFETARDNERCQKADTIIGHFFKDEEIESGAYIRPLQIKHRQKKAIV